MIPFRVNRNDWERHTDEGGILFDRCRILEYSVTISREVLNDCRRWLLQLVKLQRRGRFTT